MENQPINGIKLLFICLNFLVISTSFGANDTLHYEPEIVTLTGIVKTMVFPGPPNYENIANGDLSEDCWYLKLDHPIDVNLLPDTNSDINEPEKNIDLVQIVDRRKADWKKLKDDNHVRITGTLFHRFTGHHHALVLIKAESVEIY
jgi:hypothetical protein